MKHINYRKLMQWVLVLIALHSIGFGLALIILPINIIELFGFQLYEKFFAVQGGMFHLIISVAYIMAALKPEDSGRLIFLSCFTKFSAAIFLFSYFAFEKQIFMVFIAGAGDLLMGLAILITYILFRKFETLSVEKTTA
ncbi:MAG: hypothetical protein Q8M08_00265 [Bacteroidales bacterium]|nr:hypothetical protein [Bacteroidales bacterium]